MGFPRPFFVLSRAPNPSARERRAWIANGRWVNPVSVGISTIRRLANWCLFGAYSPRRIGVPNFIETIHNEWPVIRGAPWSFATLFVAIFILLAGGIWFVTDKIYSATISGKDATIEAQKAQINSYKDKLSGATPEEAKAKIADLEARLAMVEPRRLSTEQRNTIVSILAEFGVGNSQVSSEMSCTDCAQYAADFEETLRRVHWRIMHTSVLGPPVASPKGLAILTPDPSNPLPEAKALADALVAAKIPFDIVKGAPGAPPMLPSMAVLITPRSTMQN